MQGIAVLAEALGPEKSRFRGPVRSPFLTCITVVSDGIRERLLAKFRRGKLVRPPFNAYVVSLTRYKRIITDVSTVSCHTFCLAQYFQ
jgi:hypothetical protein